MQTVNIADLKNNLSAWLEQVKNGEELIVKDRNTPIARVMPLLAGEIWTGRKRRWSCLRKSASAPNHR
jgi:prevent-host-death family protein